MRGTVVAVLRGGPSAHQDSLRSGHAILSSLPQERFTTRDIFIDREGTWHERGIPVSPERVLRGTDAVLIALSSVYGEDGQVQRVLERFGVPFAGSRSEQSALAAHPLFWRERAREHDIPIARFHYVEREGDGAHAAGHINRSLLQPVMVASVGVHGAEQAHGFAPLQSAIENARSQGASGIVVEERIIGMPVSVSLVEDMRGEPLYVAPAVEWNEAQNRFYAPARISKDIATELARQARLMHTALDLSHYSRSDFSVSPRAVYYRGTRSLPELGDGAAFSLGLESVGIPAHKFLPHIVELAQMR